MSNNQNEQELLLAEVIIKVSAIERLLVKNNIINIEDLVSEMKMISEEVIKFLQVNSLFVKKEEN